MTVDWVAINAELLVELDQKPPEFRPTNFWSPGVQRLIDDLEELGIERFKRWPLARSWFCPQYGQGFTHKVIDEMFEVAHPPQASKAWVRAMLSGSAEARRDYDVARVAWDQERWPFDLE